MINREIITSWLLGIVHMCIEIVCFYLLFNIFKESNESLVFISALLFDFFAFVPQFIFGYLYDNFTMVKLAYIAVALLAIAVFSGSLGFKIITILAMTTGNAILHVAGAVITASISQGKLTHSAIFVGTGSIGVFIGQSIADVLSPSWMLVFVFVIFVIVFKVRDLLKEENRKFPFFNLIKEEINPNVLVIVVLIITVSRSFMGYAVPLSWKKELWQTFLLFLFMGLGKILGGILADKFGAKRIGMATTILCVPLLIFGDRIMILSIIGVFLFSMTMSITYGMLLDKFNKKQGLCFGILTIGLFLGVFPTFIFSFSNVVNCLLIVFLSIICCIGFYKALK